MMAWHRQESYWREDSRKSDVYKCRFKLCDGEAEALAKFLNLTPSDPLPTTLTPRERNGSISWLHDDVDICRPGHTGRLCEVRVYSGHMNC